MRLHRATTADLALLQHWARQPQVIAEISEDDWGYEVELHKTPEWREQFIAEVAGCPVGFVQILDPAREESFHWGDVPEHLRAIDLRIGAEGDPGQGYGT